jgi:predicted nucleic acid-binding protein
MSVVVSDTSPLHYLIQCDAVHLLPALFQQVLLPPAVFQELQHSRTPPAVRAWAQSLPPWARVQAPAQLDASLDVDEGEREAISLAREVQAAAVLMDDRKGRAEAVRIGLRVTGTIGLLEAAAARGLVDLGRVLQLLQQTNARLDPELIQAALRRSRPVRPDLGPDLQP